MEVYHEIETGTVTNEQKLTRFFAGYPTGMRIQTTNRDLAAMCGCAPSRLPSLLGKLERAGVIRRISAAKRGSVLEVRQGIPGARSSGVMSYRARSTTPRATAHSSLCIVLREWCAVSRTIRVTNRILADAACCALGAVSPVLADLEQDGVIRRTITPKYTDITLLRDLEVQR
jgi:CRP-like cAMP-binding protein